MNPKSRMVIFAVLAIAAPALLPSSSQAIFIGGKQYYQDRTAAAQNTVTPLPVPGNTAWLMVHSQSDGKYYYAPKSKVVNLAQDQSCELYGQVSAPKPLENVRLYRFKTENLRTKKYELSYVVVFDQNMKLFTDAKGLQPVTLDLKSALTAPADMTQTVPATLTAEVMAMIKAKNSDLYKGIKGGGDAALLKVYKAVNDAAASYSKAHPGKSLDAKGVYAALATSAKGQKSRLQALLDDGTDPPAASLPKPPTQVANQNGQSDAGQPDANAGGQENNPVTILTQKLTKSPKEVGESMAARIADYIINGNNQGFIAKDLRDKPDVMKRFKELPAAWVAAKVKQGEPLAVAQVYFVMGAGDKAPSWLASDTALAGALMNQNAARTAKFIEGMKPWAQTPPDAKGVGQCAAGDVPSWVHRFLGTDKGAASYSVSAVQISSAILNNPTVLAELGEIAKQIRDRSEGIAVPTTGAGTGGQPITGSAKGFNYESLFLKGAKVTESVFQTGDKVSRRISIKMYTVKEGGVLVNKVGIFDVTNGADTFGQKFSIPAGASETTFALDDRVAGKPKYTLKFEPSGNETIITFGREGNPTQMQTKVSELFTMRAQQAIDEGNITKVGDKPYYVLGQGGAKGSLLLFSGDLKDRLASGGSLAPEMAAEVNQRGADGSNQSIPYKVGRDLGKAADGKEYHLEFNQGHGYWEVVAGPGDPDPAPGTATSTTTAPGGQSGGANPKPGDALAAAKETLREGNFEINPISRGLNKDIKDKDIEIWTYKLAGKPKVGYWHVWIFPAELHSVRNMPMPTSQELPLTDTPDGLRLIDGHIVAITRSFETYFYDLARPIKVEVKDDKFMNHPFEKAGDVKKSSFNISDAVLLKDTLDLGKFPLKGKTAQDVQNNLDAVMKNRQGDEAYTITGGMDSGTMDVHLGATRLFGRFWPKIADNLNSAAGLEGNTGPGHAFDFALAPDEPFQDQANVLEEKDVNPAETVTVVAKAADDTARLYANDDRSRWYLAYRFTVVDDKGKPTVVRRNGRPGLVFNSDPKRNMPIPAVAVDKVGLRGLQAQAITDGQFRHVGKAEKGLWYAVKRKGGTPENETKPADNCLGPVIWWGMDEAAALKACQNDKL